MKKLIRVKGFTLIELLVVISIIALLISILMPALGKARESAKSVKCMANLKSVGQAVAGYLTEYQDTLPPSYQYLDAGGNVNNNDLNHPGGYLHWSYFMFSGGQVDPDAFECPGMRNGGAPRTNPGPAKDTYWEDEMYDQNGITRTSYANAQVEDRQAPRIGYGANAALVPRNKFSAQSAFGGPRVNVLARSSMVRMPSNVILAADFNKNWKAISELSSSSYLVKSHRPITPFTSLGSTAINQIYSDSGGYFTCGMDQQVDLGIVPVDQLDTLGDLITGVNAHPLNAVGRHHPPTNYKGQLGADLGGNANYVYLDGHVSNLHVVETIKQRMWGQKFYTLSGASKVIYARPK